MVLSMFSRKCLGRFAAMPISVNVVYIFQHQGVIYLEERAPSPGLSPTGRKNGEADATDCALATRHNRVALKGKLNLVSERFDNVTVALLDDKGCPILKQTISGPFGSPRTGTVSAVESLAGPFFDLYTKAKRFVQGGKCEVFYSGAVQHRALCGNCP